MKTFSFAAAAVLIIAAGTATRAEPAKAAVTVVASAATGTDATAAAKPTTNAAPSTEKAGVTPGSAATPVAPAVADTPKADDAKAPVVDPTPAPATPEKKPANVRSAKFKNGEGSVWKTSRSGYEFTGSYRGCQYRGYVNGSGYHVDKSC